ncbi:MAG: helix-turn-helix domain-containing protein [Candidatus Poribacteria bacterium]
MSVNTELLTAADAADLIGCSEGFIRKRIKLGDLPAHKERRRWQIRREDVERLVGRAGEEAVVGDDATVSAPVGTALTERTTVSSDRTGVPGDGEGARDDSVTVATAPTERMTASGDRTTVLDEGSDTADPDIDDWDTRALRLKLAASERENDLLSQDMGRLRGDYERAQDQLDSALSSVGSLTEEIKGLTVALHREQEHHALASAPVEELIAEPKLGFFGRLRGRGKRKKQVRIGHA